jgi:zinc protease
MPCLLLPAKFDGQKALDYVQQYFGPFQSFKGAATYLYTVEPPQDGERNVMLRRAGDIQYIGMAYHTPSVADKDYVANDALIEILTNDPSGVLYKKLVETKLATKVYGSASRFTIPALHIFNARFQRKKVLTVQNRCIAAVGRSDYDSMKITEEDLGESQK